MKNLKEIKLMMERLESPRLTETELNYKKSLLKEEDEEKSQDPDQLDLFTGETKELLDNTRDRLKNEVIREIEECIQQILLITDKAQEDFEQVSKLIKKLRSIPELSRDAADMILGAEISINSENFSKLQQDWNKLSKEMDSIPDKTKDPVKYARILVEFTNLIRQFANVKELFRPNLKLGKPSE